VVKPVCSSSEIFDKTAKPLCCNKNGIFKNVPSIACYTKTFCMRSFLMTHPLICQQQLSGSSPYCSHMTFALGQSHTKDCSRYNFTLQEFFTEYTHFTQISLTFCSNCVLIFNNFYIFHM